MSSTTTRGVPAGRPARPTSASIDAAILDTAAGLLAAQGEDGTSLQQVADAVGYSKTGLLHRFPSKQALLDAVTADAEAVLVGVLAEVTAAGRAAGVDLLRSVARRAVERPGTVDLVVSRLSAAPPAPDDDRLLVVAVEVIDALHPGATPRERLRVVLALQLVVNAVTSQRGGPLDLTLPPDELVDLAADLAARVLDDPAGPPLPRP